MREKFLVYIASPYSHGDMQINARTQILVMHKMLDDGIVIPYAPLLGHVAQIVQPRTYDSWMEFSLDILKRCDAVLRVDSEHKETNYLQIHSRGADMEVACAMREGINVFYDFDELYEWAQTPKTCGEHPRTKRLEKGYVQ